MHHIQLVVTRPDLNGLLLARFLVFRFDYLGVVLEDDRSPPGHRARAEGFQQDSADAFAWASTGARSARVGTETILNPPSARAGFSSVPQWPHFNVR